MSPVTFPPILTAIWPTSVTCTNRTNQEKRSGPRTSPDVGGILVIAVVAESLVGTARRNGSKVFADGLDLAPAAQTRTRYSYTCAVSVSCSLGKVSQADNRIVLHHCKRSTNSAGDIVSSEYVSLHCYPVEARPFVQSSQNTGITMAVFQESIICATALATWKGLKC